MGGFGERNQLPRSELLDCGTPPPVPFEVSKYPVPLYGAPPPGGALSCKRREAAALAGGWRA
jgi:hypothetical protein